MHIGYSRIEFFFFKQKTAYEMRISDWSSDVCSSDLARPLDDLDLLDVEDVARLRTGVADAVDIGAGGRIVAADERPVADRRAALAGTEAAARRGAIHLGQRGGTVVFHEFLGDEIGSASCRESVCRYV